jgi:hypothetical protein
LYVQDTLAHAQKSGDDKKLKVAASKKKKLADRGGLEKNDKGHRFGLNKCASELFCSMWATCLGCCLLPIPAIWMPFASTDLSVMRKHPHLGISAPWR